MAYGKDLDFRKLEVGAWVFIPAATGKKFVKNITSACYMYGKRNGKVYTRTVGVGKVPGSALEVKGYFLERVK